MEGYTLDALKEAMYQVKLVNFPVPKPEVAKYKNIPIQFLSQVQDELIEAKKLGKLPDVKRIDYRFRGPRINTKHNHTRKEHANRFSVYFYHTDETSLTQDF